MDSCGSEHSPENRKADSAAVSAASDARLHCRIKVYWGSRHGCDRRPAGNGLNDQVHVHHAKPTLTVILARFDPASVGSMARSGLGLPGIPGRYRNSATAPREVYAPVTSIRSIASIW